MVSASTQNVIPMEVESIESAGEEIVLVAFLGCLRAFLAVWLLHLVFERWTSVSRSEDAEQIAVACAALDPGKEFL